jgi:hypothetical protein
MFPGIIGMKNWCTVFCLLFFNVAFTQQTPFDTSLKSNAHFSTDTTIVLENGTTLTFSRCDFFEVRICLTIKEIRSTNDAVAAGLTTMDTDGNVLLTCGMLTIDIDVAECAKKCFDNPVKVRIPVLNNDCAASTQNRLLYTSDKDGLWKPSQLVSNIVKDQNGKEYFEFETPCAGKFNCDKRMQTVRVKFKAKHASELQKIGITSRCPVMNTGFVTKKHRKNIVMAEIPCLNPDSINITATIINRNGDEKIISSPLSKLQTKYTNAGCNKISNKVMRRILGIFALRQRNIYRKYIL